MYTKVITYTDLDGVERSEEYHFNISKTELLDMQISDGGGYIQKIQKIVAAKNNVEIMEIFKDIIKRSVGQKSPDGRHFYKSDEITNEFLHSPAYDEFFMSIFLDPDEAADFVSKVIPSNPSAKPKKFVSIEEAAKAAVAEISTPVVADSDH